MLFRSKQLLEYDNVANDQRHHIYDLRNQILQGNDLGERVQALREGMVTDYFRAHIPEESVEEQWDVPGLEKVLAAELQLQVPVSEWQAKEPDLDDEGLLARLLEAANGHYRTRMAAVPAELLSQYERSVMLTTIDHHWREHLAALDQDRKSTRLNSSHT